MGKKILIIGAGVGQVPMSQLVKERGDYLIVVTIQGDYPCIEIADKVYFVDIFNREEVLHIAEAEQIDAVISDQNDLMMPTVAYIAEKMGLPGNTVEQVECYCNKNKFRSICDMLAIPVPRHVKTKDVDIPVEFANTPFPWVVKPEDSQSSIGVSKVSSVEEFKSAIVKALEYSRNNSAIIEEFFHGREIVSEGFIYKGEYFNLGFADRRYFDLKDIFLPSETIFPSELPQSIRQEIIDCEKRMAKYVNPSFAIVHSEYLVNELDSSFCVVESAVRGGGVYISSHLLPEYCGLDVNRILLDCCLNVDVNTSVFQIKDSDKRASAYKCFYLPKGVISCISGVETLNTLPYVIKHDINLAIGGETKEMTTKGQRLGPILLRGKDRSDIENKLNDIKSIVNIQVTGFDGGVYETIWD